MHVTWPSITLYITPSFTFWRLPMAANKSARRKESKKKYNNKTTEFPSINAYKWEKFIKLFIQFAWQPFNNIENYRFLQCNIHSVFCNNNSVQYTQYPAMPHNAMSSINERIRSRAMARL